MNPTRTKTVWVSACAAALLLGTAGRPWSLRAQAPEPAKRVKFAAISEADAKEWLTYLSSDALQGRQVFTEGYGLAVSYIAEHLKAWGLKPIGDGSTYFQTVKRVGYRVTRNSSITVEAGGQSRTFKHGDHVTFPAAAGGKQTLTFNGAEFLGYGAVVPTAKPAYSDYADRDVKGQLVVMVPGTPSVLTAGQPGPPGGGRGGNVAGSMGTRVNYAIQTAHAAATIVFAPAPAPPSPASESLASAQAQLTLAMQAVNDAQAAVAQAQRAGGAGAGRGGGGGAGRGGQGRGGQTAPAADFTSVQRVDNLLPPQITADETFYDFLFSGSPVKFADIRAKAESGSAIAPATLAGVKITVTIDNTYDALTTELTKNVVGMVDGSDPRLKDTYVLFGAHLDHIGYSTGAGGRGGGRTGGAGAAGSAPDLINNGADDDGSGSTALLGIAKAFATGPKPKRSVVFVWHAGEESGLLGSRYNADFPVVPLDKVQCQLNIDMIGRNRDDDPAQANNVFVIGADRISTDLHNLVVDTNGTLAKPLHLDYEYNDPSDSNSFYTRSDHYSYALKGIPIAFFFTGTHPDYHRPGDEVQKILFPKLVSIAQLVYQTGFNAANSERTLERDNLGPRTVRGFQGRIKK
jgi:hypothetical protein